MIILLPQVVREGRIHMPDKSVQGPMGILRCSKLSTDRNRLISSRRHGSMYLSKEAQQGSMPLPCRNAAKFGSLMHNS